MTIYSVKESAINQHYLPAKLSSSPKLKAYLSTIPTLTNSAEIGQTFDQISANLLTNDKDGQARILILGDALVSDKQLNAEDLTEFKLNKEIKFPGVHLKPLTESALPDGFISSVVINQFGNLASPSMFYREPNSVPRSFNLSHRKYFKSVRSQQGWNLAREKSNSTPVETHNNVYIQRLRNITNGTIGTTISMPLFEKNQSVYGNYVLIADVVYTIFEMFKQNYLHASNESEALSKGDNQHSTMVNQLLSADFAHMVVNRNSGQVIFHSQVNRSLNENLFYSGNNEQGLAEWIKSSGASEEGKEVVTEVEGYYHGFKGSFYLYPTIIDDWALVVFAPTQLTNWFLTNKFLYYFVISVLLILVSFICIKCYVIWVRYYLKQTGLISREVQRRLAFFMSVLLAVILLANAIISIAGGNVHVQLFTLSLGLLLFAGLIYLGVKHYKNLPLLLIKNILQLDHDLSAVHKRFWACMAVIVVLANYYLSVTSNNSVKGVEYQYTNFKCASFNAKTEEITQQALSLFPNSISNYQLNPINAILGDGGTAILQQNTNKQQAGNGQCNNISVMPDDFPNFATAVGNQQLWRWLNQYVLSSATKNQLTDLYTTSLSTIGYMISMFIGGLILLFIWLLLHTKILWTYLYLSIDFLRHVEKLSADVALIPADQRSKALSIKADNIKLNGVEFNLYASLEKVKRSQLLAKTHTDRLIPASEAFTELAQLSPIISLFTEQETKLPNLKMELSHSLICDESENKKSGLKVELWDVETCLECRELRQHLLCLIVELKGLVLTGKINELCVYSGFHCLQRVALKDALIDGDNKDIQLGHIEYLSWSECLMDFSFDLPKRFSNSVDLSLLASELDYFPELKSIDALKDLLPQHSSSEIDQGYCLHVSEAPSVETESQWATINLILIHAEAFYRFKWELCSNAEKLGLFNLAKRRYLNPNNSQMIEHLALNGLIRVENDDIRLVNESFAYFVLNAEPPETMGKLFKLSEQGVWKSYRLPIIVTIALLLAGIAMVSGESLFIIFGSIAGVLTTIASMTSSANLIRNQLN
ncbi:hypothetical protein [Colwellia sp. MEBiC06753]